MILNIPEIESQMKPPPTGTTKMNNGYVVLPTTVIQSALQNLGTKVPEIGTIGKKQKDLKVNLSTLPKGFIQQLLLERLTVPQRTKVLSHVDDIPTLANAKVGNCKELFRILNTIQSKFKADWLMMKLGDRSYPVSGEASFMETFFGARVWMPYRFQACDHVQESRALFDEGDFLDVSGKKVTKTVRELLESEGLRLTTPEDRELAKLKALKASRIRSQTGLVLDTSSEVFVLSQFFYTTMLQSTMLGTKSDPRRLIVESELEILRQYDSEDSGEIICLPFVRAWSSDLKKYVYSDVDDVTPHEYIKDPRGKLVLPDSIRTVLDAVFHQTTEDVFGDAFNGRHGGVVILANGPSGVGKTLTAEVYSEYTKRSLYSLEMGELGTSLVTVEKNLQKIFTRATRWNSILLFDEADIFLSKRQETDLERSAIVGVFLRLLDRYKGTFFLTTNRAEVIDPAFKSRITLKIDYPELTPRSRAIVWDIMLKSAGFTIEGETDLIASEEINGRQIRNQVRLLGALHPSKKATIQEVKNSLQYVAK